ncbi:MAG: TetR family transcriptional regulator C-terminal domain-containing protein [Gammaproteobacteria bacterium]|nr:TetR family transcriptional regulator C-terminal domain-containing protein [Gammaproteobacteria bacterium]
MITLITKPRRGRPPKNPHSAHDVKAALIRSGLELFTEQGFSSSGIDQILKRIGVPKGSFYHYFANKEAFGQAVIDSYASYFATKLDHYLLDQQVAPLLRISNFVADAKLGMQRHQFKRGCLIGNLGQEVSVLPESYRAQLVEIFVSWQKRVAQCLKLAQTQGDIAPSVNCDLLAEFFWVGWEGAVSRAKLEQDSQPLDNYFTYFMSTLIK